MDQQMTRSSHATRRALTLGWRAWIAPLLLATAGAGLAGCAAVATYEKCGRAGCRGDAAITAEVRRLYRQHPAIEAPNLIDVQTLDGVVYLYGTVDTDMQRELATSVALEAGGVTRVVNAIGINNQGR